MGYQHVIIDCCSWIKSLREVGPITRYQSPLPPEKTPAGRIITGTIPHRITGGFASQIITAIAAKVPPTLGEGDAGKPTSPRMPLAAFNQGVLLRLSLQTLSEFRTAVFAWLEASSVLEIVALSWRGGQIGRMVWRRGSAIDAFPVKEDANSEFIAQPDLHTVFHQPTL